MKKVKKQIDLKFIRVDNEDTVLMGSIPVRGERLEYVFGMPDNGLIPYNNLHNNLEVYTEVDEAETIKEFRKLNNLSKEQLVEWLNKNYK